ncbi:flagellin [Azospirillum sp. A39]|uniref:flagellin n=1 Tax=Azospirillum sp. A39 TaxID=3462279 RepID=UPI0040465116
MSTITQVGSYAKYLGLVRTLSTAQSNVDDLSRQMTTGTKSVDLKAYGPETQKLLDLRAELVKRQNYVQNIDSALPRVKATDVVLTSLEQMASDWQSNNLMPFNPGPVSLTAPYNDNPDGMQVRVNTETSTFTQNARYTVTATPSATGGNGTFDVTVTDGLGGRSVRTLNLSRVPPTDGDGYNFTIAGGPGEGAVLNLSFDKLSAAGSSSFTVSWPQADQTLERVEGAMRDMQQLLNERFGDRFLFSGSRFADEPVTDLMAGKQHSKITFNGQSIQSEDYFEITLNGKTYDYQVQPGDPKTISFIAGTLANQMQAEDPPLPVMVTMQNGIITFIAKNQGEPFTLDARVVNAQTVENWASEAATTTLPSTTVQQVDRFTLGGAGVDIGDTFEFTVAVGDKDDPFNQKYYNTHPDVPHDLPAYQEYTVRYTVTAEDYAAGITSVTAVAGQLATQFSAKNPAPPVTMAQANGVITLTSDNTLSASHPDKTLLFSTSAKAVNGTLNNTVTVATLPVEATPLTDVPYVGNPSLPFYDAEYMDRGNNTKAWEKSRVTVEDGYSIEYGVVSTDPAFQTLVQAFRMARVAASNPGKYEEYIEKSRALMSQALDSVRSVHAKVASDLSTLEQKKEAHQGQMNGVVDQIASIEGIDQTEVAARLSAKMNTLEAAYTVAGKAQQLSLLNYIA